MQDFRKIRAWQKAHALTLAVYEATRAFPADERFGLTAQLRRATVSIESNIAEGRGRGNDGDFARFLSIALGSAFEVECQLLVARDLAMLPAPVHDELQSQIADVKRLVAAYRDDVKGPMVVRDTDPAPEDLYK